MINKCGRFLIAATCRCGDPGGCPKETYVQAILRLKRAADTPDADVPGDHVVFVPEDLQFPDGWTLNSEDLMPRCPDHGPDQGGG